MRTIKKCYTVFGEDMSWLIHLSNVHIRLFVVNLSINLCLDVNLINVYSFTDRKSQNYQTVFL